jgi:hypothetical protein
MMYLFKTSPRVFLNNKYTLNSRELFFIKVISESITLQSNLMSGCSEYVNRSTKTITYVKNVNQSHVGPRCPEGSRKLHDSGPEWW